MGKTEDAEQPLGSGAAKGTPVSSGVAQGTAYVLPSSIRAAVPSRRIADSDIDAELARFQAALVKADNGLATLKALVAETIGASEADIFAAQALVLADPSFRNQVIALVRNNKVNVEQALAEVIEKFTRAFDDIPDPYLRERASDIRDVGRRVLSGMLEEQTLEMLEHPEHAILVADELLPSVTARLDLGRARGFVTERGGKFSHTSILARSQGLPAVAGIAN
ncbi:MAG TPA: phosphoenolpyruvate-utilizing N-terminal domain-containing protein, partial [Polyangia bacterium]|nr:phosphoenolpyruvate-utilizing N-terminal domain-containing protein [Polyangia bacterium]